MLKNLQKKLFAGIMAAIMVCASAAVFVSADDNSDMYGILRNSFLTGSRHIATGIELYRKNVSEDISLIFYDESTEGTTILFTKKTDGTIEGATYNTIDHRGTTVTLPASVEEVRWQFIRGITTRENNFNSFPGMNFQTGMQSIANGIWVIRQPDESVTVSFNPAITQEGNVTMLVKTDTSFISYSYLVSSVRGLTFTLPKNTQHVKWSYSEQEEVSNAVRSSRTAAVYPEKITRTVKKSDELEPFDEKIDVFVVDQSGKQIFFDEDGESTLPPSVEPEENGSSLRRNGAASRNSTSVDFVNGTPSTWTGRGDSGPGTYTLNLPNSHSRVGYYVELRFNNHMLFFEYLNLTPDTPETANIVITQEIIDNGIDGDGDGEISISGEITDATIGGPDSSNPGNPEIEGANVSVVRGWVFADPSAFPSEIIERAPRVEVDTAVSEADGSYKITGLPAGFYTITASKEGYIPQARALSIYEDSEDIHFPLLPTAGIGSGDYKIVLTWGDRPYDLDSHLVGRNNNGYYGGPYHLFFGQMRISGAELDVDDVWSFGPETITVTNLRQLGGFTYLVHNYSGEWYGDTSLVESNAVVNLFQGGRLIRRFNVPSTLDNEFVWPVFSIDARGRLYDHTDATLPERTESETESRLLDVFADTLDATIDTIVETIANSDDDKSTDSNSASSSTNSTNADGSDTADGSPDTDDDSADSESDTDSDGGPEADVNPASGDSSAGANAS